MLYALPVNEVCLSGLGLNLRPGTRILAVGQGSAEDDPVTAVPLRVVSATEDKTFNLTKVILTRNGVAPDKVRSAPPFQIAPDGDWFHAGLYSCRSTAVHCRPVYWAVPGAATDFPRWCSHSPGSVQG